MNYFMTVLLLTTLSIQGCKTAKLGSMEIAFRDADSQKPITNAQVELQWQGLGMFRGSLPEDANEYYWRTTDENGVIKLDQCPEGMWKLVIDAKGYDLCDGHTAFSLPIQNPERYPAPWSNASIYRDYPFAPNKKIEYRILMAAELKSNQ